MVAYAAEPVGAASGDVCAGCFNQYEEVEISTVRDCALSDSRGNAIDNPAGCILFAYGNNICSGQARTVSRGGRMIYRYNPIAFLKFGRAAGFSVPRHLRINRRLSVAVKLSPRHGFIRLRKLLI